MQLQDFRFFNYIAYYNVHSYIFAICIKTEYAAIFEFLFPPKSTSADENVSSLLTMYLCMYVYINMGGC